MTLNPFRRAPGILRRICGQAEPLNTFTNILRRAEIGAISRGMMLYGLRGWQNRAFAPSAGEQNVPDG